MVLEREPLQADLNTNNDCMCVLSLCEEPCATNDRCLLVSCTLPVSPSNVLLWVDVVFGPILDVWNPGGFYFMRLSSGFTFDERVQNRTVEQIVEVPVPQMQQAIVEVIQLIPQERISTRPVLAFSAVAFYALIFFVCLAQGG